MVSGKEFDNLVRIAQLAHEVNRAYCKALGDESQPSWNDAPSWQSKSALDGVIKIHRNRAVGVETKPSDSHESWMKQKLEEGWEYGEVKDPERKLHPCMVPFNDLPSEQKAKDYLFVAVVSKALELFG